MTDDLNQRVQERLAEMERFASNTMPRGPVADPIGYVVWKSPTTMGPIVESWRDRIERHEPEAAEYPQCGWCFNMYGSPLAWPCADYLSVCREIGVES